MSSVSSGRRLGRGLDVLIGGLPPSELVHVPVEAIHANPRQPRRRFDPEATASLAESVRAPGILQPVVVRSRPGGGFELIAGERRWRAARLAGLDEVPAVIRPPHDDAASLELALIENMAREDLNPVDEARACAALVEDLGLTREEVGRRVGRSRVAVSNLVRLLDLPDEALELLAAGALSEGHGRALLLAADHDERSRLAAAAVHEGWSVRTLESRAREAAGKPARPGGRPRPAGTHPDQDEGAEIISDALGSALGRDVRVTPKAGGYRAELSFSSPDEALELAARLRRPHAA